MNTKTFHRSCKKCGGKCCTLYTFVELKPNEVQRMQSLGAKVVITPHERLMDIDGGCQFLKEGKCSIYHQRPNTCREWDCSAMSDELLQDKLAWVSSARYGAPSRVSA